MSRYCNIALCTAVAALVAIGLVMLASTVAWIKGQEETYHYFWRQAWMAGLGVIGAVFLARVDPKHLRRWWPLLLSGASLLLVCCYIPGIAKEIKGRRGGSVFLETSNFSHQRLRRL